MNCSAPEFSASNDNGNCSSAAGRCGVFCSAGFLKFRRNRSVSWKPAWENRNSHHLPRRGANSAPRIRKMFLQWQLRRKMKSAWTWKCFARIGIWNPSPQCILIGGRSRNSKLFPHRTGKSRFSDFGRCAKRSPRLPATALPSRTTAKCPPRAYGIAFPVRTRHCRAGTGFSNGIASASQDAVISIARFCNNYYAL